MLVRDKKARTLSYSFVALPGPGPPFAYPLAGGPYAVLIIFLLLFDGPYYYLAL